MAESLDADDHFPFSRFMKGPPPARVAASEDEVEEAPATPTVTPVKTPKTPKEPATTDKEPKRRKREVKSCLI